MVGGGAWIEPRPLGYEPNGSSLAHSERKGVPRQQAIFDCRFWSEFGPNLGPHRADPQTRNPRGCRQAPWKQLVPPDVSGVTDVSAIFITPDGNSYVYEYGRTLSDLVATTSFHVKGGD